MIETQSQNIRLRDLDVDLEPQGLRTSSWGLTVTLGSNLRFFKNKGNNGYYRRDIGRFVRIAATLNLNKWLKIGLDSVLVTDFSLKLPRSLQTDDCLSKISILSIRHRSFWTNGHFVPSVSFEFWLAIRQVKIRWSDVLDPDLIFCSREASS